MARKKIASRQTRYIRYLTEDPNGPHMRRLDLLVPSETYSKFEALMFNTNSRRREALVAAINSEYDRLVGNGTITPDR